MATKLLKDLQIRNAKPLEQDYRMQDGEGLYVLIRPNGSKLWRYNYSFENKKYVYSIGKYPDISLEKARILHQDSRSIAATLTTTVVILVCSSWEIVKNPLHTSILKIIVKIH